MTRVIPTNRRLSLPGSPRWWIVTALVAASMVVLDAWSKSWVERVLGPSGARESVEIVGQFVELHYGRNSGVAFGLLSGSSGLAAALVATVIVPLTVVLLVLASKGPAWAVAAGLLLGGAAGNLVDRAGDQTVTDFISVGRWPSFNLADSAITLGSLMLIALSYRDRNIETQHVT